MATIDRTIPNHTVATIDKLALAVSVDDALAALGGYAAGTGGPVIAAPTPASPPARANGGPAHRRGRRSASLGYPDWHAHLAGIRRWVPGENDGHLS